MKFNELEKLMILPLKRQYYFRASIKIDSKTPQKLKDLSDDIYKEAYAIANPVLLYKIIKRENCKNLFIPQKFEKHDTIIYWFSTLGIEMDKKIALYISEDSNLKAMLLDAWASEALECLNDHFQEFLTKNDYEISRRFSPGYGDFSILENIKIIKFIGDLDSCVNDKTGILSPQKSTVCCAGLTNTNLEGLQNNPSRSSRP